MNSALTAIVEVLIICGIAAAIKSALKKPKKDDNDIVGNGGVVDQELAKKFLNTNEKTTPNYQNVETIKLGTESWERYKRDFAKLNKSQQQYELEYFKKKLHKKFKDSPEKIKDQVDEAIRELELIYRA